MKTTLKSFENINPYEIEKSLETLQSAHKKLEITLKRCAPNKSTPDKGKTSTTDDKQRNNEIPLTTNNQNTNNRSEQNKTNMINNEKASVSKTLEFGVENTMLNNKNKTTVLTNDNNQQPTIQTPSIIPTANRMPNWIPQYNPQAYMRNFNGQLLPPYPPNLFFPSMPVPFPTNAPSPSNPNTDNPINQTTEPKQNNHSQAYQNITGSVGGVSKTPHNTNINKHEPQKKTSSSNAETPIDLTKEETDETHGTFLGVHKHKYTKYFVGNISEDSNSVGIQSHFQENGVTIYKLNLYTSLKGENYAQIVVHSDFAEIIEGEQFVWPDGIYCKQWRSPRSRYNRNKNDNA